LCVCSHFIFGNAIDRTIREALGLLRPNISKAAAKKGVVCRYGKRCQCEHPPYDVIKEALEDWFRQAHPSTPVVWGVAPDLKSQHRGMAGSRSAISSGGGGAAGGDGAAWKTPHCQFSAAWALERLERHRGDSPYVEQLLSSKWLPEFLADPALRRMFVGRNAVKEVTEAGSSTHRVQQMLAHFGHSKDGQNVTIIDACSGKGFGAALMSQWIPKARVVMMDADGNMDLSHVRSLDNVHFVHADLFASDAPAVFDAAAAGSTLCIALGVHLCGELSPRLVDVVGNARSVSAVVLSPCCLKGGLGFAVKKVSSARGIEPYDVLVETLSSHCSTALCGGGTEGLACERDLGVLSPKNAFISAWKQEIP
jgi:hypothetical protein